MSEISKLKVQRGFIKGTLTRQKNYLITVDPENLTDLIISQLQSRLERVEPLLSQFEELQQEIEECLSKSEQENVSKLLEAENLEHVQFEDEYFEIVSKIKLYINQSVDHSQRSGSGRSNNNSTCGRLALSGQSPKSFIKLPDLKLPIFNGSYEKWLEFRDAFQAIVHENSYLSNVEKFYYLKSYLQNEPLQVVANLQVTNDNYPTAWSLLTDRYENKQLIVYNYIKALFDCPNVSKESYTDLRNLYDLFNKNLRSLNSLGQNTQNWDTLIVYLIVNKFDAVTRREWESHTIASELPTLIDVNLFLKSKCELLEKLETSKQEVKVFNKGDNKIKVHTAITESKFSCYYCKKNHSIYKCFAFNKLDVAAKIAVVNNLKICENCFNNNHTQNCPSPFSCRFCGKKHNSLLHRDQNVERSLLSRPTSSHEGANMVLSPTPTAEPAVPTVATTGHAVCGSTMLSVLATVNIRVVNDEGKVMIIRALLDPGSQSNFMTESLAQSLNLQRSTVNFEIMGVGETLTTSVNSKVNVTIMSNINDYSENISCLVVPKLTQNLPTVSFDISNWKIPDNLRLADESFNIQGPIDILLGVDIFYRCLLMKQIRNPGMPVLQKTRFGWVIGGYFNSSEMFKKNKVVACHAVDVSIEEKLTKFWEIEEGYSNDKILSESQQLCEDHFTQNLSIIPNDLPEQKLVTHSALTLEIPDFDFNLFFSLLKLQRVFAYCLRFIRRLRNKEIVSGSLNASELTDSLNHLLRMCQIQSFAKDYNTLKNNRSLANSSQLLCLKPYIDEMNLIRVGGRIQGANVSVDQKHPIVLHNKHPLTNLILKHEHVRLLHCGPQQLLYTVRQRFWPICGRRLSRSVVKRCITCFRANPVTASYNMGNLPKYRVTAFQPVFSHTGLDYAGPISIRDRKTRNPKILKAYICIFVCMSTKCVHLEIVSDLTSQAFLAVLKRFIARRGKPLHLYSDNGTNFVGANSALLEVLKSNSDKIGSHLSAEGIYWHFIPPRAPNFGGLWEAGVKSLKFHLKRIIADASLTYEDLSTVITQIEGVMNSRPLSPLSSDPQDLTPLTPAHFLVGKPLTSLPEEDVSNITENRLTKFQRYQQLVQQFWKRWNKEYISELQSRVKWKKNFPNLLKIGSLVIIKEDNVPVCKWKIGRVIELHPGVDNVTRVVTVQCSDHSLCKRAITKLCVLPVD